MKRTFRNLSSLLLALVMLLSLSVTAFAADSSVTYEGGAEDFVFLPGSDYTDTDLFDGFKNVMPGDTLTEKITIKNDYKGCDYVKIYIRAEIHNEEVNPLSEKVEAAGENVASMTDFLKHLSMTVKNGDDVIYEASPDKLDGLRENVLLGSFERGEEAKLTVTLEVPLTMGNEYANREGEVDWVFVVEEHNHSHSSDHDDDSDSTSTTQTVDLVSPKTGDDANPILWISLAVAAVLTIMVVLRKRNRREEE